MKKYFFLIFILIPYLSKADNYIIISPVSQSGTVESNTEIVFYFNVYCGYSTYNNDITYLNIGNPNNTDGFLNVSGGYGSLYAGTGGDIIVKFKKNVNTTTTMRYDFACSWYTPNQQFGFGSNVFTVLITYTRGCPPNINITQNVNTGVTDIQESSNTITATNTIFPNGIAAYDTGTTVYLKPNFHAKHGSNFRAFIEGCQSTLSKGTKQSLGVKEVASKNEDTEFIKLYPNPTKGILTIESSKKVNHWMITDAFGKSYYNGDNAKYEIDMSNFPKGIYFLKAILTNGEIVMKKVIKN